MSHIITAIFKTRLAAENVMRQLESRGVTHQQISLVLSDETRGSAFGFEKDDKTEEGFATGAAAGGIIGGVLGGVAAASTIVIPGLNLVVTGTLVSALTGIGAGATAGGLVGGLIGAGIPEYEAKTYEDQVKEGSILMAVSCRDADQKKVVKDILADSESYYMAA